MNKFLTKMMPLLLSLPLHAGNPIEDPMLLTGVDINGKIKSCTPLKNKVCTKIFTQGDEFAQRCREQKNIAIQCDCHEWICIKK